MVQSEVARQPGGRSKGWGLVDYESPEAATAAIAQLHNSELQGRSIIVRLERAGGANKSGGVNAGRPEASSGLQIVVRYVVLGQLGHQCIARGRNCIVAHGWTNEEKMNGMARAGPVVWPVSVCRCQPRASRAYHMPCPRRVPKRSSAQPTSQPPWSSRM